MKIKALYFSIKGNKDFSRLIENFFSLTILKGIDVIFPLITMPYLVYILGMDKFGLVTFATVIAQYIVLFSNYGFAFSATKQISINRDDILKVSKIFWSVLTLSVVIALIGSALLLGFCFFIPKLSDNKLLYIFSIGIVLGNSIIPTWLFQGLEKMKFLTLINIITKGTFTVLIFFIIKNKNDFFYVTLLNSLGYIVSGAFSIFLSIKLFKLKFYIPTWKDIKIQLKDGWQIFISTVSMSLYRNSNVLILGTLTSDIYVGYYAAAEKIIKAIQALILPVSNALYPYFSRKFAKTSEINNIINLLRVSKYYYIPLLLISLLLLMFSKILIPYIGNEYVDSIVDIQIMSFVVFFGCLNYFFGILGLVNLGYEKKFTNFVMISGLISISFSLGFAKIYYDKAASFSMLLSEFVLFILIIYFIKKIKNKNH